MGTANPDKVDMRVWRGGCETVQQMLDQGWDVISQCQNQACRLQMRVDLAAMVLVGGPDASLWNRTPPCRRVGCAGAVWFLGRAPRMSRHRRLEADWPEDRPARGVTGYRGPR
jgi:hypothetical protein